MQLSIRHPELPDAAGTVEYVERRVRFALGRFAPRITRVTVRLDDENGPRGGVDKSCRIEASVRHLGSVRVEDRDATVHAAVARAADRLSRAVARKVAQSRNYAGSREVQSR